MRIRIRVRSQIRRELRCERLQGALGRFAARAPQMEPGQRLGSTRFGDVICRMQMRGCSYSGNQLWPVGEIRTSSGVRVNERRGEIRGVHGRGTGARAISCRRAHQLALACLTAQETYTTQSKVGQFQVPVLVD